MSIAIRQLRVETGCGGARSQKVKKVLDDVGDRHLGGLARPSQPSPSLTGEWTGWTTTRRSSSVSSMILSSRPPSWNLMPFGSTDGPERSTSSNAMKRGNTDDVSRTCYGLRKRLFCCLGILRDLPTAGRSLDLLLRSREEYLTLSSCGGKLEVSLYQ